MTRRRSNRSYSRSSSRGWLLLVLLLGLLVSGRCWLDMSPDEVEVWEDGWERARGHILQSVARLAGRRPEKAKAAVTGLSPPSQTSMLSNNPKQPQQKKQQLPGVVEPGVVRQQQAQKAPEPPKQLPTTKQQPPPPQQQQKQQQQPGQQKQEKQQQRDLGSMTTTIVETSTQQQPPKPQQQQASEPQQPPPVPPLPQASSSSQGRKMQHQLFQASQDQQQPGGSWDESDGEEYGVEGPESWWLVLVPHWAWLLAKQLAQQEERLAPRLMQLLDQGRGAAGLWEWGLRTVVPVLACLLCFALLLVCGARERKPLKKRRDGEEVWEGPPVVDAATGCWAEGYSSMLHTSTGAAEGAEDDDAALDAEDWQYRQLATREGGKVVRFSSTQTEDSGDGEVREVPFRAYEFVGYDSQYEDDDDEEEEDGEEEEEEAAGDGDDDGEEEEEPDVLETPRVPPPNNPITTGVAMMMVQQQQKEGRPPEQRQEHEDEEEEGEKGRQ